MGVQSTQPRVILMCGLPGAGKTTVAKRWAKELSAVRLCPDEWMEGLGFDAFDEKARERVERLQWALAEDLLAAQTVVILENGFWSRGERDHVRSRARALGVAVTLCYLDVPSAELHERVALRSCEPGAISISDETLAEYERMFEAPTSEELDLFDPSPMPSTTVVSHKTAVG